MSRKLRVNAVGFYHIINRGVAKSNIFCDMDDFLRFLEITQETSDEYEFEIYSFCLMNNHYHLLLKTTIGNLSTLMQKINSRYSIYFNNRYKRIGPLWQGRFKSWFVWDERYLETLVRYIEKNPIKAKITKETGDYKWAMSSDNFKFSMLNFELIKKIDLNKEFDDDDTQKLDEFLSKKLDQDDKKVLKPKKKLEEYFELYDRQQAVFEAAKDGYTQKDIANYLSLSYVSISKILKNYRQKVSLFNKLRDKVIFWSYDKSIKYEKETEALFIEYLLKYGDFEDIGQGFKLFGKRVMKHVWEEKLKSDKRFIKLNFMIARVFLGMNVEASYFKEVENARFEKFKMLAS